MQKKLVGVAHNLAIIPTLGLMALPLVSPSFAQDAPPADAPTLQPANTGTGNDWLTYKGNPQRTAATSANLTLPLNLLWRHSTDAPVNSSTPPVVAGPAGARRVYFAAGTTIYCVDAQTGARIWRSAVLNRPIAAPISLVNGENGDYILAVTSTGVLSAIRTSDGGTIWTADARSSVQSAAPVIADTAKGKRIIVGIALGRLLAFTLDGALDPDWEVRLSRLPVSLTSTPALSGDGERLFITAQDQKLYAVNLQRGQVSYAQTLTTTSTLSPMVLGDQVYVTSGSYLYALKEKTGDALWRTDTEGREISASPVGRVDSAGKPVVYLGAKNGYFLAVDGKTGRILWRTDLQASVTGTPTLLSDMILTGTSNGVFYALNPNDGTVLWQYRLRSERAVQQPRDRRGRFGRGRFGGFGGGRFGGRDDDRTPSTRLYGISSPASVVNGQAFLLADNAALYAFDTTPTDAVPPRVVEPSLSVPNNEGRLRTDLIGRKPIIVPGKPPVYFAAQLDDAGSGIDPRSLHITTNGDEVPTDQINFQVFSGILTVTLAAPAGGTGGRPLPDGLLRINIQAKDYAGNPLNYTGTVTIDNTLPPPTDRPTRRRRGGVGGFPGGFPGGDPGGGDPDGGNDDDGMDAGGDPGGDAGGDPGGDPAP